MEVSALLIWVAKLELDLEVKMQKILGSPESAWAQLSHHYLT